MYQSISIDNLELVRHFDCSYNELVLSLELFSNEDLKISIVSLKDLTYFQHNLDPTNIKLLPNTCDQFNTTAELCQFIVTNASEICLNTTGLLTIEKPKAGLGISIQVEQKDAYKYQVLWWQFMQIKRDLKRDLDKNTKYDQKRYDEVRADLDLLRKADSDTLAKIDGLDKKYTTPAALEKVNNDVKTKFEAFQKKQQLSAANNSAVIEQINSKIKTSEGKMEDFKKSLDTLKADNKDRLAKLQFKLIDTQSALNNFQTMAQERLGTLESATSCLKSDTDALSERTTAQLQRLQKAIKELQQHRESTPETTVVIRDFKATTDLLRDTLEKYNRDTKGRLDLLEKKSIGISEKIDSITCETNKRLLQLENADKLIRDSFEQTKTNFSHQNAGLRETIQCLQAESKGKFASAQASIVELRDLFQGISTQIKDQRDEHKAQSSLLQGKVKILSCQLRDQANNSNQALSSKIQRLQNMVANIDQLARKNASAIETLHNQVEEVKNVSKKKPNEGSSLYGHHPKNPQKDYFSTIRNGQVSLRVRHVADKGYQNFINKSEIAPGKQMTYRLKPKRLTLKNLYLGLGTYRVFGCNSGQPEEGLYYYCGNGSINAGGVENKTGVLADIEDEIMIEVDLEQGKVAWRKNGQLFYEGGVPEKMAGKSLFLVIRSYYKHDEVEILF